MPTAFSPWQLALNCPTDNVNWPLGLSKRIQALLLVMRTHRDINYNSRLLANRKRAMNTDEIAHVLDRGEPGARLRSPLFSVACRVLNDSAIN